MVSVSRWSHLDWEPLCVNVGIEVYGCTQKKKGMCVSKASCQRFDCYMHNQHQNGENTTMSSRALTSQDIREMWEFNQKNPASMLSSPEKQWGRERTRCLVHAIITISFVCLLRVEETLSLRHEDIEVLESGKCLSITLRKRKTNQFGGEATNLHLNLGYDGNQVPNHSFCGCSQTMNSIFALLGRLLNGFIVQK